MEAQAQASGAKNRARPRINVPRAHHQVGIHCIWHSKGMIYSTFSEYFTYRNASSFCLYINKLIDLNQFAIQSEKGQSKQ
jgi:hypothetical protein